MPGHTQFTLGEETHSPWEKEIKKEKDKKKNRKGEMNLPGKETILICFATKTTTIRRSRLHGGIFYS